MKGLCLTGIIALSCISNNSFAKIENDKMLHFSVSTGIGAAAQVYFEEPLYSFSSCIAVGLAKEVYDDIDYGGFSKEDLAYDIIGCGLGVAIGEELNISFKKDGFNLSYNYRF